MIRYPANIRQLKQNNSGIVECASTSDNFDILNCRIVEYGDRIRQFDSDHNYCLYVVSYVCQHNDSNPKLI